MEKDTFNAEKWDITSACAVPIRTFTFPDIMLYFETQSLDGFVPKDAYVLNSANDVGESLAVLSF